MKKLVFILIILTLNFELSTFICFAQPNGGFESWSIVNGNERPDNWQTLNFLSSFGNPVSAFKASGADKHSGDWALKLKTVYLINNPAPHTLQDSIGDIFTGKIILSPPSLKFGIPFTGRPEKLEFWCKYIPVGTDVAGAFALLQKWNGTKQDTIAYGDVKIYTTLTYTLFQINLDYHSTISPDTVTIAFSSSYSKLLVRAGSTLYIDDVVFTGWVGIDEHSVFDDKVKIFPNPAKDNVTIHAQIDAADNMRVVDVSGKLTGEYKIQNYETIINTTVLAEGIYFFEIRDKKDGILTKGKFNVIR
jgi:hypothetical protein